jgi:NTP pyrophosphatase (non-canonical NTP hydrolase)
MGWVWDEARDGFWVDGASGGQAVRRVVEAAGGWFPPDAPVEVRHGGRVERSRWDALEAHPLPERAEVRLPGNPTGAGPILYVMDRLLGEDGCPWDRAQTPRSLVPYLLDEAYEAAAAVLDEDWDLLGDELGDVLLQVVFHAALQSRAGRYDFAGVVRRQAAKLVGRHPHVFAGEQAGTGEAVRRRWEALKAAEGPRRTGDEAVMPALLAASRRARRDGVPDAALTRAVRTAVAEAGGQDAEQRRQAVVAALWGVIAQAREWHLEPEWVLWETLETAQKPR